MTETGRKEKQYGLIVPKKKQISAPRAGNIFGDDSGSDAEDGTDWVKKALKAEGEKNRVKKQTQLTMKKALKENPTVYQYDEVYDEMERTKEESKAVKKEEKKPKYITNLLLAADRRKREQEHRIERMVQKEREAEGAMFADKESFVTSAYRAKLEEFKKMEEEELRMDRLESIGDVTKQQDMSGFYRHLYAQTVDGGKQQQSTDYVLDNEQISEIKEKDIDEDANQDATRSNFLSKKNTQSDNESTIEIAKQTRKKLGQSKKNRQYRKRNAELSDSDSEIETDKMINNTKDVGIPLSSKSENPETEEPEIKKQKLSPEKTKMKSPSPTRDQNYTTNNTEKSDKIKNSSLEQTKEVNKDNTELKKKKEEKKVSIWEKRTVGPVFEAALQRYYERKAMRLSGS
ncbi:nuclear speckle splicing regulatory protein 1 [Cephus cinctus]|uniref:Nuclear speckle splicing regulatory protein 1 n=1 Tax=Cephus cinctus TaxID=211228 RepID=A0AAJ7FI10_CEPCN|nr:nuclear speckle splicing regulatory protein 1 [Cephus cinctus]XP_024939864.1 nuclear speckle splicing regulatory protein 1 [Cephus cinctus]